MNQRNHIEKELKLCLSEAHYISLCEYLVRNSSLINIHEQCNIYLETEDNYFANNREMLRLRRLRTFGLLPINRELK